MLLSWNRKIYKKNKTIISCNLIVLKKNLSLILYKSLLIILYLKYLNEKKLLKLEKYNYIVIV